MAEPEQTQTARLEHLPLPDIECVLLRQILECGTRKKRCYSARIRSTFLFVLMEECLTKKHDLNSEEGTSFVFRALLGKRI